MKIIFKLVALSFVLGFLIVFLSSQAHAGTIGGPHGGMSSGAASPGMMGMQAGPGQHGPAATGGESMAAQQGGQGGKYQASVVDGYQPWPESEMRQFQKP